MGRNQSVTTLEHLLGADSSTYMDELAGLFGSVDEFLDSV